MSKLVAREAQNHQAPGEAALQLVKLSEVPGGCASERGHILNQHSPAPERVEIYLLPIQTDGAEVVEGLGDVSHGAEQSVQSGGALLRVCGKGGEEEELQRTKRNHTMSL